MSDATIRRTISGLSNDANYVVRVRSYNNLGVASDWSEALMASTGKDTTIPSPPTDLAIDWAQPNMFVAWKAPAINVDGTPIDDLRGYKITFTVGAQSVSYETPTTQFTYVFSQIHTDFPADPTTIDVAVYALDILNQSAPVTGIAIQSISGIGILEVVSPDGSISVVDPTGPIVQLELATPHSGFYASLTGAGETSSPGDLTQVGGFAVNASSSSAGVNVTTQAGTGLNITDNGSGGINIYSQGTGGFFIDNQGTGEFDIVGGISGAGIVIEDSSSTGIEVNAFHGPVHIAGGPVRLSGSPNIQLDTGSISVDLFVASTNPNGHVTALAVGDLCITDEPALYQARATGSAGWVQLGSNTSPTAWGLLYGLVTTGSITQTRSMLPLIWLDFDAAWESYQTVTVQPFKYTAGSIVLNKASNMNGFIYSPSQTTPPGGFFAVYALICDLTGTNTLELNGTFFNNPLSSTAQADLWQWDATFASWSNFHQVGTDLSIDGSGNIVTAAGGMYSIQFLLQNVVNF